MTKSLVIDGRTMNTVEVAQINEDWFGWADAPGGEEYDEEAASKWYEGWCEVHQCSGYECACASKRREQFEAGFGAQVDADLDAGASWPEIVEQFGEDVDFAQADMLYRDAEASWYRFVTR